MIAPHFCDIILWGYHLQFFAPEVRAIEYFLIFLFFCIAYIQFIDYNVSYMRARQARQCARRGDKMYTSILSADLPYAEIAFFAILAIGLILGLVRGFSKSFQGVILSLAIIICSVLLISPTFTPIRSFGMFTSLENTVTESVEGADEIFALPITVGEDGLGNRYFWTTVQVNGETQSVALENAMGSDMASSLKGKAALWLAERFVTQSGQTIGSVAGVFVCDIVVMVVMFLVYCIALHFVCHILRKIFSKMHASNSEFVRGLDRTAGAIVSTILAFAFILIALAIIYAIRDKIPDVDTMISSTKVCGYIYQNNPITALFTEIFG